MRERLLPAIAVAALLAAASAGLTSARAEDAARAQRLRALADAYCEDGDLARARSALEAIAATPSDLLAILREPARPDMEGGTRTLEIKDEFGKKTELLIIAPPTEVLKKRTRPLGLIVLLHGLGGAARNATPFAEKLCAQGDVICVAPTATKLPLKAMDWDDGIPEIARANFKHWWSYDDPRSLTLVAIDKARELFWIDPERVALGGVSMGGYGTWNIGLRFPDRFCALAPIAGGISRFGAISDKDAYSRALLENGRNVSVFSAHGTKDPLVPCEPDREACEYLKKLGGTVEFLGLDVGHTPADLKRALEGPELDRVLRFMAAQRRCAAPASVKYVALSEKQDGAHWLRIKERSSDETRPVLEGRVDETHTRLIVETRGCRRARVYLDERILDGEREVEVVANGRRVFKGKIEASLEAVLESWRSRRDPGLVYAAFVDAGPRFR